MLRRLITLLALLTGLAAAGAPAQALVYDAASGVELAAGAERSCKGEVGACVGAVRPSFGGRGTATHHKPAHAAAVVVPTVRVGVDRAYE